MAFGLRVCVVIVVAFLSGTSGASVRHSGEYIQDFETSTSNANDRDPKAEGESRENIMLEFVDSVTGEVLVEASPTTRVRLRLRVRKGEDPLESVSPFRCEAWSTDGQYHEQLTDDEGCGLEWSMTTGLDLPDNALAVYSGIVRLPDFLLPSVLQVSCQFHLCLSSNKNPCKRVHRCEHVTLDEKTRVGRDSETSRQQHHRRHHHHIQQQQENEQQIRSTSIRVLPSVNYVQTARKTGADTAAEQGDKRSHTMGHPDPFLYLNPITCSLFLVLLVVFLILYVAFLRSLRRSIEEIKREIEAQRSRDKFLIM